MRWADPYWLTLLVLVPLPWLAGRLRRGVPWPALADFPATGRVRARLLGSLSGGLRGAVIAALVLGLARPQTVGGRTRVAGQGVSIVVALDRSSSMNAADFPTPEGPVSRLEAARSTLSRFIAGRPDDVLGLVVFANYPRLACPPTLDHAFLQEAAAAVRPASPADDGTNLGDALIWALQALRATTPKKKVLVLLTDGRNSPAVPNPTPPALAAEIARGLGVTLHTIAVGRGGGTARLVEPRTGLPLTAETEGPDLDLLRSLAVTTGGRLFEATDGASLRQVFGEIDALEKSPVRGEVRTRYDERFRPLAAGALALLLLERFLSAGRLRRLP